jgi:uncharacterized spore protein YtfJ
MTASDDLLRRAQDALTTRTVFGEPFEKDGVTIIPTASVRGAGGGGGSTAEGDEGEGAGYAVSARPVGAWVHKNGDWTWRPAFDLNRFFLVGNLVAIAYFVSTWLVERARNR